jgi:methylase of polypeptide subunit release factors
MYKVQFTGLKYLHIIISSLHRIYIFFVTPIRSNKIINLLLFGFYPRNKKYGDFWDWTTIRIKSELKKYFSPNMSLLDVGTGAYGILLLYAKIRLKGKSLIGCDHCEDLINNAIKQTNDRDIIFYTSDLFENIQQKFDCIVFNAPYIDKEYGLKIGVLKDDLSNNRWSGGQKGTSIIERFVKDLSDYLSDSGFCLLGVNHFYVKNDIICNIINNNSNIDIINYHKNKLTKSAVYVIKKRF